MPPIDRAQGLRRERVIASPQFEGGRFHNPNRLGPWSADPQVSVAVDVFANAGLRVPSRPLPVERPHEGWRKPVVSGLRVTWLGHSTVLLEIDGRRVLTDPVFAERVAPVPGVGPRRFHPAPSTVEELPPLDLIVLSHDHYDHLCEPSMRKLAKRRVPVVTALGVGARLAAMGFDPSTVTELDWNEHVEVPGLRVTATPCQHFSGRTLFDRNRTLWASWVIEGPDHKVFFSGDTGLTPVFEDIGRAHGPFDLVMLEIGAFHPSWAAIHLGPENALEAFRMLGGGTLLPVHWGTFNLALHPWHEPAEQLHDLSARKSARILTPLPGRVFEPDHADAPEAWWRPLVGERNLFGRRSRLVSHG